MINLLIRLPLTSAFFFAAFISYSQLLTSFTIIESSANTDIAFYENSLSSANLEKYRLEDQQRILQFADGVQIALLSRKEVRWKFGTCKEPETILSNADLIYPNEFQLLPSGIVVERVPIIPAKK